MHFFAPLIILSAGPSFLGFNSSPTLEDVIARFGNPMKIEQNESRTEQTFTFNREAYLLNVRTDLNNQVTSMEAYGVNKSVNYNGIRLGSQFKDIVNKLGAPKGYVFGENYVETQYDGFSFKCQKINQKKSYEVTTITVSFPYKKI